LPKLPLITRGWGRSCQRHARNTMGHYLRNGTGEFCGLDDN